MKRVAIYARISLDTDKTQQGVDRQLDLCRELAAQHGATSVREYVDNDVSAFSGVIRPGFEKLLTHLAAGQYDAVVCYHTDRLYRRLADLGRVIDAAKDLTIHTVSGGDLDLSNSTGEMTANILASVAQQESARHGERRRTANEKRRQSGAWRKEGSRPFGFHGDGTHREPEAAMIRTAVMDILAGTSIHSIARRWNASGVLTVRGVQWTNLHVRRVLSNPRIAALIAHKGEIVGTGNWEPIVEETLWRGLQALLTDPSRRPALAWERVHLLSGVAKCAVCLKPLYGQYAHGRNRTPTYICRDSHVARSVPPLDKLITELTLAYLGREGLSRDLQDDDTDLIALEARRTALQKTKGQLAGLLRKGLLSVEDVERDAAEIQAELDDIGRALASAVVEHPAMTFLDPDDDRPLQERWNAASIETKAAVIDAALTIKVHPARSGQRTFDPALIEVAEK
jgi:site-specific DNA recombinase